MSEKSNFILSIFKKRNTLTLEELNVYAAQFFMDALEDPDSAKLIAEAGNRITQRFKQIIKAENFILFVQKYPELITSIAKNWSLDSQMLMKLIFIAKQRARPVNRELIAQGLDGRTQQAVLHNRHIQKDDETDELHVEYHGKRYPLITRHTRRYDQPLVSAGSDRREMILLDPNSLILQGIYTDLKKEIAPGCSTKDILLKVLAVTQNQFNQGTNIDDFVNEQIKKERGSMMPLDLFLTRRMGVCRHHSLLNAYLLDRLVQDQILEGDIIHHRETFKKGAHTWNLYRDYKDGKLYSLDSLWKNLTCLAEEPGAINKLYREDVETRIAQEFGFGQVESNSRIMLENIKFYIESTPFEVNDYFFFKGGVDIETPYGNTLRVPHHVAEIYQLLNGNEMDQDKLLAEIKDIAKKGLDGASEKQHDSTQQFYHMIIDEEVPSALQRVSSRRV